MHPYPSDFFPFFPLQISCWFSCLSCWLDSCRPCFIDSFQRKQLVPQGPSYGRKERSCTTLWSMEIKCWKSEYE
jgi:hypothetical protein